jgi:hypothetical protein
MNNHQVADGPTNSSAVVTEPYHIRLDEIKPTKNTGGILLANTCSILFIFVRLYRLGWGLDTICHIDARIPKSPAVM